MPTFLIVHATPPDGRIDAYLQPPTLEVGGMRAPLDWGDVTLHVPSGDLPVTVFATRADGAVLGATITVRAPAGTGTRLTFVPSPQPGGASLLRIDGQWPSDASMYYYAARDARVLAAPAPSPSVPSQAPVGPTPGSLGSVPTLMSSFGRSQGSVVDPVQHSPHAPGGTGSLAQPPHLGPHPTGGVGGAGSTHPTPSFGQPAPVEPQRRPGDRQPPPIPTPAEFHLLEQAAAEAQRRVYEAWQAHQAGQQPHSGLGARSDDGRPAPIGLQAAAGQAQPAWYRDPFGRAEQRWYDGRQWTASVMRGGVRGVDQPG